MARFKPFIALLLAMLIWGVTPVFLRSFSVELGPADALVIRYVPIALTCIVILAVTGKRPTPYVIAGLALAIAGTVLLVWDDLGAGSTAEPHLAGMLLLLLACFAWAFYSVPGKVIIQRYGTLSITAMSLLIGTIPMLVLASPATIDTLNAMTPRQWLELAFLAGVSSFMAMFGWTYATARLPASTIGPFLYLIPVIAVLAGALILGESVTLSTSLGGLLILGGIAVAQFGQRLRRVRHEQNAV